MTILGINSLSHDVSVALIDQQSPILLLEEERFSRQKHHAGFFYEKGRNSWNAMDGTGPDICLSKVLGQNDKIAHCIPRHTIDYQSQVLGWERRMIEMASRLDPGYKRSEFFDHHICHAASAYFPSGYQEAYIVTSDGGGHDNLSAAVYIGKNGDIRNIFGQPVFNNRIAEVSVGHWFSQISQKLRMNEGSLMALSSYGTNLLVQDIFKWDGHSIDISFGRLDKLIVAANNAVSFEEQANVAYTIQSSFENALMAMIDYLCSDTSVRNICLAGGSFLSCQLVRKIRQTNRWDNIFVPPCANDGGLSLGAACLCLDKQSVFSFPHASYGTSYTQEQVIQHLNSVGVKYTPANPEQVAELLHHGKIVAIFDGRMEFGPRALGNRSLLADPRKLDSKERLNAIKQRQFFRPVAPAVLDHQGHLWFEDYVYSPFMTEAFVIKENQMDLVPAIKHKNGTARIQSVRNQGGRFEAILEAFFELTGIPMLCNTSFNVQEPIIESIEGAVNTFFRSDIDCLYIEGLLVTKT